MNNKPLHRLLPLVLLFGSLAHAQPAEPNDAPASHPKPAATSQRAATSSDPTAKMLDRVELSGVPFREAIERLREQSGANMFVSWNVLKRAGIDADAPVDVKLADVTLGRVLDLVFADVAGGEGRLAWTYDEGVVRVSTYDDLERGAFHRRARESWNADMRVRTRLDERVADLALERDPFWRAVETLADRSGIPISVRWRVVEAAGVKQSAPVTVNLQAPTAAAALAEVLKSAGGDRARLDYAIRNGVIEVTTADDARRLTEVRVYDVTGLLPPEELKAAAQAVRIPPPPAERPRGGGEDAAGRGDRGRHDGAAPLQALTTADELRRVIVESVDPDGWRENGGHVGSIGSPGERFRGVLVVTQTRENHEKIERLLDRLSAYAQAKSARPDEADRAAPVAPEADAAPREAPGE